MWQLYQVNVLFVKKYYTNHTDVASLMFVSINRLRKPPEKENQNQGRKFLGCIHFLPFILFSWNKALSPNIASSPYINL
jgi:hypothetical protein